MEKNSPNQALEQALAALKASEERFSELAENTEDVFYSRNASTGELLYISPACERLIGRKLQSFYDKPGRYLGTVHPDDLKAVKAGMPRVNPDAGETPTEGEKSGEAAGGAPTTPSNPNGARPGGGQRRGGQGGGGQGGGGGRRRQQEQQGQNPPSNPPTTPPTTPPADKPTGAQSSLVSDQVLVGGAA